MLGRLAPPEILVRIWYASSMHELHMLRMLFSCGGPWRQHLRYRRYSFDIGDLRRSLILHAANHDQRCCWKSACAVLCQATGQQCHLLAEASLVGSVGPALPPLQLEMTRNQVREGESEREGGSEWERERERERFNRIP
jgi:hypothetical protein